MRLCRAKRRWPNSVARRVLVRVGIPVGEYEAYYNKQHYTRTSLSITVCSLARGRARAKKLPVVLAIGILKK